MMLLFSCKRADERSLAIQGKRESEEVRFGPLHVDLDTKRKPLSSRVDFLFCPAKDGSLHEVIPLLYGVSSRPMFSVRK